MSRRVRIVIIFLLALVLATLAYQFRKPEEPLYKGKSLRGWLEQSIAAGPMAAADTNAVESIRHFGAGAVPTLLQMARVTDSPLKKDWIKLVRSQRWIPIEVYTDEDYRSMACTGFYALGPMGKEAVTELIKELNETNSPFCGITADCLGNIGPDAEAAVPSLLRFINGPDKIMRWDATINLSRIHMRPELVVPTLTSNLLSANPMLPTAIDALGAFGDKAKSAVPVLLTFLNDKTDYVRITTTNALKKIDPQAAAAAGIK